MSANPHVTYSGPSTGNVIRDSMMGLVPETVEEIIQLNGHVWRDSLVAPSILETLRLRNARTVNCVFCQSVRYDVARADGLTEDKAAMIDDGYAASALTPQEKAAIMLADAYLGFPSRVDSDTAEQISDLFKEAEIASMMVALMTFNFTSRAAVCNGGMPETPLPIMEVSIATSGGEAI